MRSDMLMRLVLCLAVALPAASDPAIHILRGHGLWLLGAALLLSAPAVLLTERGMLPHAFLKPFLSVATILVALAIQSDSHYGINLGLPYAARVAALCCVMLIFISLGEKLRAVCAPETEEERARP